MNKNKQSSSFPMKAVKKASFFRLFLAITAIG